MRLVVLDRAADRVLRIAGAFCALGAFQWAACAVSAVSAGRRGHSKEKVYGSIPREVLILLLKASMTAPGAGRTCCRHRSSRDNSARKCQLAALRWRSCLAWRSISAAELTQAFERLCAILAVQAHRRPVAA